MNKSISLEDVKEPKEDEETISNESVIVPVVQYDLSISLKELKETTIVLRQKLDTLESERNVMDVEYSQVYFN